MIINDNALLPKLCTRWWVQTRNVQIKIGPDAMGKISRYCTSRTHKFLFFLKHNVSLRIGYRFTMTPTYPIGSWCRWQLEKHDPHNFFVFCCNLWCYYKFTSSDCIFFPRLKVCNHEETWIVISVETSIEDRR